MFTIGEVTRAPDHVSSVEPRASLERTGLEAAAGILIGLILGLCLWGALVLVLMAFFA